MLIAPEQERYHILYPIFLSKFSAKYKVLFR